MFLDTELISSQFSEEPLQLNISPHIGIKWDLFYPSRLKCQQFDGYTQHIPTQDKYKLKSQMLFLLFLLLESRESIQKV